MTCSSDFTEVSWDWITPMHLRVCIITHTGQQRIKASALDTFHERVKSGSVSWTHETDHVTNHPSLGQWKFGKSVGYGSIPINPFLGGWTSIYQLFSPVHPFFVPCPVGIAGPNVGLAACGIGGHCRNRHQAGGRQWVGMMLLPSGYLT